MATGVEELVDMLFAMIDEAKSVPLSSEKCIIERDRALDLLDDIKAQFPMEFGEAKKLLAARADYIASAKREADLIRKQAEDKMCIRDSLWMAHATPLVRRLRDADLWMQENKVQNLRLAAARLDGMTLLPGETLSYWRSIGNPTRRKGYVEGMLLRNGRVVPGVGGGLCQCSNLLYWMTLHTPLAVTERHRHGYDVFPDADRTQPFGSGATCFYNYLDLTIRNDTPDTWRLMLRVTDTHLEGEWRCSAPQTLRYEVYEKEHYFQGEY